MPDNNAKLVLITGGSGGLGRALAVGFLQAGEKVVITARSEERLRAAAAQIGDKAGPLFSFACDITQRDQVEALEKKIREQIGAVKILINNAGIAPAVSFLEMQDKVWEEVLKTNLSGTYHCSKVFLPAMIQSGWGRIINIGSTTAKVAYSHVSAYVTSKHAVLGLTRSLALETARSGVTVNMICPGYLNTELTLKNAQLMAQKTSKAVEDILKLFGSSSPQNRLIEPEEVAQAALMLASEKASGITGQTINVDGGAVMA
jgi:NAD(P)-dependent dehydrogenase (short-subunit alcohol dehydrogenase family)